MSDLLVTVGATLGRLDARGVLDILIIASIFYWLLLLLRRTTAMSLLRGIVIILVVGFVLSNALQLTMVGWILRNSVTGLLVAIPILFQPELRRALESVGRTGFRRWVEGSAWERMIDTVIEAARILSERRYGAILVLERETGLKEYIGTGIEMDATASVELLLSIFFPNSALHDGAVIIRGDRIIAAACVLPLSENVSATAPWGTRHRAAIGITERTDATSIVISEETGNISLCTSGRIVTRLDEARLRRVLTALYRVPATRFTPAWRRSRA
ncbi:MAG: TIGR00159 family protein [Chloroflexi bacterium]|nr:TIGR00159 family protein [Chloroflexota bacterium]